MGVLTIKSPIPRIYQNALDTSGIWDDLNLIPYRGIGKYASHAWLRLMNDLYKASPTHATCIKDLREMAFMGDIDLSSSARPGLKVDPEGLKLDDTKKVEYCDFIEKAGFTLADISSLAQCLFSDMKWSGNAYLHYREVTQGSVKKVYLKKISPMHVMYVKRENENEPKTLYVSKQNIFDFTTYYTFGQFLENEKNYELINSYPDFTEKKGVRETIFHLKNNDGESDYYGMPDTLHTVKSQYIDAQLDEMTCQTVSTDVTAKKWIVLKKEARCKLTKEQFESFALDVRSVTTTEGKEKSKTVAFSMLPEGLEIEDYDFDINRDTADFLAKQQRAINNIYSAHGVDKEMTGIEQVRSSIGEGAIMNVFLKYDHKVIKSHQQGMSNFFLNVNKTVCEAFEGMEGFDEKYAKIKYIFPDKTSSLQEDSIKKDGNINQLGGQGE